MQRSLYAFCFFVLTCLQAPGQSLSSRVDSIIIREMNARKIPGVQVAVVQGGRIVLSNVYGIANLEDQVPVTRSTVFPINSCTKVFTSVAIMQLAEQGKLKLTDQVALFVDSLPSSWQHITINQLLTHSSGLPDILQLMDPLHGGVGALKNEKGVREKLFLMPEQFPAGKQFSYNQTNFYLLGKIIEKLLGKPFAQAVMDDQVLRVGLTSTAYADSRNIIPHYAPTYRFQNMVDGKRPDTAMLLRDYYEFPYFTRTGSGLTSTAEDLAKWTIALKKGELLRSTAWLDSMWTPSYLGNGAPTSWARGWGLAKFRKHHRAMGMSGGSRAAFLMYPDDDLTVIVLTNLAGTYPEDYLEEIAGVFIPDIINADPISFLKKELKSTGFDKAITVTNAKMKSSRDFRPGEFELNEWAYRMMSRGELKEAKEIFKLNVALFPDSWNTYDSYAEALLKLGFKEEAISMYKKSVTLNPDNKHGKDQLKLLE